MLRFWKQSHFVAVMGIAAGLSLVRGFAAAAILIPVEFGIYALIVAVGSFLSSPLGLGRIEATRKSFPRLFVDGRIDEVVNITDRVTYILARRVTLATLAALGVSIALGHHGWAFPIVLMGGVAFALGWNVLLASAQRASPRLYHLGATTLLRAVLALGLGVAGAFQWGWEGIGIAEVVAAMIGNVIARLLLRRSFAPRPDGRILPAPVEANTRTGRDGLMLFIAFMALSVPMYLGRAYVAAAFDAFALGQFSFLMLFVTAAATVVSILDQRIGPQLMRLERNGAPYPERLRHLLRWCSLVAAFLAGVMMIGTALILLGPLDIYAGRYALDLSLFLPIILLGVVQISTTFDWMLQSGNQERQILSLSAVFLGVAILGAAAVAGLGWTLAAFIWSLAIAKLLHIGLQLRLILSP